MDRMTKWIASLLRIARAAYVVAATASILVTVLGLVVALYFQFIMTKGPSLAYVPPIPQIALPAVTAESVDNRIKPPMNIRFVLVRPLIVSSLSTADILGYFQVDTFNGLAPYPEDVDILGGKDSDLFDRRNSGARVVGQGAALVPTAKLIERLNSALQGEQTEHRDDFTLVVVAHDIYGVPSQVTDVHFTLTYGQVPSAPTTAVPPKQPETPIVTRKLSDLERLARDIALIDGPEGSKPYTSAYDRALREPGVCGTSQNDTDFVVNYRRLFDHAQPKLATINLPAFYDGVCESWQKAKSEQARALAAATAAQYAAINSNRSAEVQYQYEAAAAWVSRNATLIVVGSAFGTFLTICFVLAFLAMENHSNAMRNALTAISESRRNEK